MGRREAAVIADVKALAPHQRRKVALAIADLTSAVFDNGRRGGPRPGCDCEQCFGYCMIDGDKAAREGLGQGAASGPFRGDGSLDLNA